MHEKKMEIRWRDVDAYQHINNSVYLTYLEEVRDEWFDRTVGSVEGAGDFVLVRVSIDFRRELTLADDAVVASCRVTAYGNSSITTHEDIRAAEGWLAAESESVMVAHDPATRKSRRLSPNEKAALEQELTNDGPQV